MIDSGLKGIFIAIAFFFSITAAAQITRIDTVTATDVNLKPSQFRTQRLYMYTIGLKVYSLEEFPKILNQTNPNDLQNTVLNGLFVKLNDNQISYRLSANYYRKNISFKNECEDCEEANGRLKDFSTRIGFEKNFIYGAVQPYLAFDIGYRRNSFKGDVKNASSLDYTNPYEVSTLKNGFSMSPNFGLKVSPISHITIAVETGITLLYSYEKQERVYNDAGRTRTFSQFNKWEFLLRPVSMLSLQYNFGFTY
ncbi:hypothetical protein ACFSJU_18315 [Paradesertivirga mongoliensis]|uniref:Outer membrane protein beta-barrel domain-containing protein n=1 Tax=Paradesertivirga mongoliensis TaxID=2100740 RepID=A0ABW4ZRZ1_9SPHI|nr:hypothetical protein [Pedobacter mongoliensis]